jgi:hypothetical protein
MRQPDCGIARGLPVASECHALGNFAAAFGRRRQDQIGRGHSRNFDLQIDAVEERSGNARLVIGGAVCVCPAPAGETRLISLAAAAWVHRRHQHEARRIGDAVIGARNRYLAAFQRLAQRVQHLRLEFRRRLPP